MNRYIGKFANEVESEVVANELEILGHVADFRKALDDEGLKTCDRCDIIGTYDDIIWIAGGDIRSDEIHSTFPKFAKLIKSSKLQRLCPKCLDLVMLYSIQDNCLEDYRILIDVLDRDEVDPDGQLNEKHLKILLERIGGDEYLCEQVNQCVADQFDDVMYQIEQGDL